MAKRKKVLTAKQTAAVDFKPLDRLVRVPKEERIRRSRKMVEGLVPFVVMAVELSTQSKESLIEGVSKGIDPAIGFFDEMNEAIAVAKAVEDILSTARARLLIAMAAVELQLAA